MHSKQYDAPIREVRCRRRNQMLTEMCRRKSNVERDVLWVDSFVSMYLPMSR